MLNNQQPPTNREYISIYAYTYTLCAPCTPSLPAARSQGRRLTKPRQTRQGSAPPNNLPILPGCAITTLLLCKTNPISEKPE